MANLRSASRRKVNRCIIEALEGRRLLSVVPAPYPGFVGPLPQYSDPMRGLVAPGAGPSSELLANDLTSPLWGSYTFHVIYRSALAVLTSSIDSQDVRVYGPGGYERTAALVSVDHSSNGPVRMAKYKIAAPSGNWTSRDNGRYRVVLRPNQVFDTAGVAANDGIISEFHIQIPGVGNPTPPPIKFGIDVRDFGAIPNDGIDDTDAIQAAIDSLPVSNGVPAGGSPVGGVILLPAGVFDISRPLKLHSGITLRGAGHATVIHDVSIDRTSSALQLYSPFVHRYNIGVTIEHLSMYTRWTSGLTIDPNMGGDVTDLRLHNVRISSFGPAIDLRNQAVYFSTIEDVEVYNPGSTALHLSRAADGVSNANSLRNFRVTGTARSGFRGEAALVYVGGNTLIQNGISISTKGARTLPLLMTGRVSADRLEITVPPADCPGGFAVRMLDLNFGHFEQIRGIGIARRLQLTRAFDVQVKHMTSDGTSNVLSHIANVDVRSYLRVGNAAVGRLQLVPPPAAPAAHTPVPAPTLVIDPAAFGLIPSDGGDDTAALQAAIDSLPRGNGIPGSGAPVGGIIQLPRGVIDLSAPIKLPSGVWLRGHDNGTVLRNYTTGAQGAVIELTSPYTHRSNVGAGVMQLGMQTHHAAGIRADATVEGELRDLRLIGLRLTTGGPCIDLRDVQVNHARLERIVMREFGSTALWLGRDDNSSVGNLVRDVRVTAAARNNFVAERALFVYYGETRIEGGSIEETFVDVLPFYGSGKFHILDLYMEYPQQADNIGFVFDNATGYIDNMFHVDPRRQLHFINGSNIEIGTLNILGVTTSLRECVAVDGTSRLTLNGVLTHFDAGMLDHPRINVRGVYSVRSWRFVETSVAMNGNYLADPNMTNVSDTSLADWTILWGDTLGAIQGTWAVENVGGHQRLRLTVLSNPNQRMISLRIKVNAPASVIGRPAVARWRIDGYGDAFVYTNVYGSQYQGRVMRSQTAVHSPRPIAANEQIWIDITNAQGTYYVWKVGLVAL